MKFGNREMTRRQFISRVASAGAVATVGTAALLGTDPRRVAAGAARQKFTLRLSHSWAADPVHASGHILALRLRQLVAEKTDGQLEIKIFPASQLGKEPEVVEGIKSGKIDLMTSSTTIWATLVPKLGICDLPYLFLSFAQARRVLMGPGGAALAQSLTQTTGAWTLGFWGSPGFRNVATKSKEVKNVEDLKGLKIGVGQTPTYVRTFELLGANPTPMAFGEVHRSIQKGVLEGWEHDAPTMASSKMYEVTKYLARTDHLYGVCFITANARKIDSLPEDLKSALGQSAADACAYMFDIAAKKEEDGIKLLRNKGMVINTFDKPPAYERVRGYWNDYADKVGAADILTKMHT